MQRQHLADADLARQTIGNKKGMYKVAEQRGLYLPGIDYKVVTEEYLMELLKGNIFCIPKSEIKLAFLKNTSVRKG